MIKIIEVFIGLLIAVATLALLSRKLPVPYPILLVLGGLLISLTPGLPAVQLAPDVVFLLLLPPLLYPAALLRRGVIFGRIYAPFCCSPSGWCSSPC